MATAAHVHKLETAFRSAPPWRSSKHNERKLLLALRSGLPNCVSHELRSPRMVDHLFMQTHEPIVVPENVHRWESSYRLPEIVGTPRQIAWARLIRHQFLSNVFANLLDATAQLGGTGAKAVFACVDELRGATDARQWIEEYRFRLGDPTAMVLAMPAMKAARRAEEERLKQEALLRDQRAAQNRKLAKEASAWESEHDMPRITGASDRQVNFARRCRYQLRRATPEEARKQSTDAGYWIAQFERSGVAMKVDVK